MRLHCGNDSATDRDVRIRDGQLRLEVTAGGGGTGEAELARKSIVRSKEGLQ